MNDFNKEKAYDERISPLVTEIIKICKQEGIPMVASFCYAKGRQPEFPNGIDCCTTHLPDKNGEFVLEFSKAITIIKQ